MKIFFPDMKLPLSSKIVGYKYNPYTQFVSVHVAKNCGK